MRYFRVSADILVSGSLESGGSGGVGVSGDGKFDTARRELIGDRDTGIREKASLCF